MTNSKDGPRVVIEVDTQKRVNVALLSKDKESENLRAMELFLQIKGPLRRFQKDLNRVLDCRGK